MGTHSGPAGTAVVAAAGGLRGAASRGARGSRSRGVFPGFRRGVQGVTDEDHGWRRERLRRKLADVGFGVGYAQAQDGICLLAETFLTVDGERSAFLGPEGTFKNEAEGGLVFTNLNSDVYWTSIKDDHAIQKLMKLPYPQGPSTGSARSSDAATPQDMTPTSSTSAGRAASRTPPAKVQRGSGRSRRSKSGAASTRSTTLRATLRSGLTPRRIRPSVRPRTRPWSRRRRRAWGRHRSGASRSGISRRSGTAS